MAVQIINGFKFRGKDLTGEKFNRLLVESLNRIENRKNGTRIFWACRCDCGNRAVVEACRMRSGHTQSCGCYQRKRAAEAKTIHGGCGTASYDTWRGMIDRCCNPNNEMWENYGGRGISICKRWRDSFEAFRQDMGERPENMTLDRRDNDGNYEPGNCRWATNSQQGNNRRTNHLLTFNSKTQSMTLWAIELGLPFGMIRDRLERGWNTEDALSIPKGHRRLRSTAKIE